MSEAQNKAQDPNRASTAPETPGQLLRSAREAAGLSVEEVAKAIKFAARQVEALEADDYGALPGTTIVRGFVRSYARHLRLSEARLLASLDAVAPVALPDVREPQNMGLAAPSGGLRGPGMLTAIAIVLAIAALLVGVWHFFGDHLPIALSQRAAEPAPSTAVSLAAPAESVAVETAVMPSGNVATPADKAPVPPVARPPQPVPAAPHASVPAAASVATAVATPAAVPAPSATVPSAAEAASPADGQRRLTFIFRGKAWIEVRDVNQKIVLAGEQPAGGRQELSGRPPFHLVVGNAAQVDLFDGERRIDLTPHTRADVARLRLD